MSENLSETTHNGLEKHGSLKDGLPIDTSLNTQNLLQNSKEQSQYTHIILTPLLGVWESLEQDIMQRTDKPKHPIGLSSLDEALWGIHKKELMVLGGRTSMGKSALGIYIAKQLADMNNQRVIYFTLEMSKEQILERLLSMVCRINNLDLRKGRAKERVMLEKKTFEHWIGNVNLLIDDKYGYVYHSAMEVCDIIRPDFVIVDYVQMISVKGFHSKLEAIEEYVRMLKQLSIQMNFGVILLSQLNRMAKDDTSMIHFKWAGVLEECADSCLTVKWEWTREDPRKYIVNVEKQRHGEVKNGIIIDFYPEYSDFAERGQKELKP